MDRIEKINSFVEAISNGNFATDLGLNVENDRLGSTLIKMKENLKEVSIEDKKRNWSVTGQAKFGDILRTNNDNIELLAFNIIKELTLQV